MKQLTQTQTQVSPLMALIFRLLNQIEMIALIGTAVGFAMLYAEMAAAPDTLMIGMSVLSATFFLKGYDPSLMPAQNEGDQKPGFVELLALKIIPKTGWIACAMATVGILFVVLKLKGSAEMLMIGCSALTAVLVLIGLFVALKPDRSALLIPLTYRAVPLWLMGGYLFMNIPTV